MQFPMNPLNFTRAFHTFRSRYRLMSHSLLHTFLTFFGSIVSWSQPGIQWQNTIELTNKDYWTLKLDAVGNHKNQINYE